jgi:hypothetical protein
MTCQVLGIALVSLSIPSICAAAQSASPPTFSKDIAPILQRSCQNCHNPDGGAPMSLVTYEDVRSWARAIKLKVTKREMPPYFVESNIGIQKFKDDPRLSDREIAKVAAWVDAGAPRGNPADMPPPLKFAGVDEWTIGTPDLVVSSPTFVVKAIAPDYHGEIGMSDLSVITETRYIKAVEVKEVWLGEGNKNTFRFKGAVVHHAALHAGPKEKFSGTATANVRTTGLGSGVFRLTYELGQNATVYPDMVAVKIEPNSVMYYSMHLHANGVETPGRIDVGFKFHPRGYQPKFPQSGFEVMGQSEDLDLPGGQENIRIDGFWTMPKDGILTTFEPHMHMTGVRMCAEAVYPDGRREMLNCAGYNHNWVRVYTYAEDAAPLLPKGTIIHIIGYYNNSPSNPRATEPRNWKGWGNRTIDDMFINLAKVTYLTPEQFKEEVAARAANARSVTAPNND